MLETRGRRLLCPSALICEGFTSRPVKPRPKAPEILAGKVRVIDNARLDLAVNGEDCAEYHVQFLNGTADP